MSSISFSGLASGIDSTALIKATSDAAKKQRVEPLQKKVSELSDTNASLEELRTKLGTLRSRLQEFASISGGGLAKEAASSNESAVVATARNAASNGIYTVSVTQKAKNSVLSFDDRFAATSAPIKPGLNDGAPAADRTVAVTVGTGASAETVNVVLTSTTTPNDFVTSFNTSSTKAQASLVNVGTTASPAYAIMISSDKEGLVDGQVGVSAGAALSGPPAALASQTIDQATDARFSVSGLAGTISRPTNSVSDVIPGLTFEVSGTGTSTVTVTEDVAATTAKMEGFVEAYNEVVTFLKEQNVVSREENGEEVENVFAALASTRVDDNALQALREAVSSVSAAAGTEVRTLPDLGVTTERDGTLKFDPAVFQTAMAKEPTSVDSVMKSFADRTATTGGSIDQITRFGGMLDLTVNGNKDQVKNANARMAEANARIVENETQMRARFARLEALMGRLQGQQQSLMSALGGLG